MCDLKNYLGQVLAGVVSVSFAAVHCLSSASLFFIGFHCFPLPFST